MDAPTPPRLLSWRTQWVRRLTRWQGRRRPHLDLMTTRRIRERLVLIIPSTLKTKNKIYTRLFLLAQLEPSKTLERNSETKIVWLRCCNICLSPIPAGCTACVVSWLFSDTGGFMAELMHYLNTTRSRRKNFGKHCRGFGGVPLNTAPLLRMLGSVQQTLIL